MNFKEKHPRFDELNREMSELNDIEQGIILDEKIVSTKVFELDRIRGQLEDMEKENLQSEVFIRNSHDWAERERKWRMCEEVVWEVLLGIEKIRVRKATQEVARMKAVAIHEFTSLQRYLREFEELECVMEAEMRKVRKINARRSQKMGLNSGDKISDASKKLMKHMAPPVENKILRLDGD